VFQRSDLINSVGARWLPFVLLPLLAVSACSPGSGSSTPTTHVQFLNVEMEDSGYFQNGMFQLYLNRNLDQSSSNWNCVMTLPAADAQNNCAATAGSFDEGDKKARLYLTANSAPVILELNFKEIRNVTVRLLNGNDQSLLASGRARIEATQMDYSSHMDADGSKSLRLTLYNIPPQSGDGAAFDTGDLFVTPSSDSTVYTMVGAAHAWSADYTSKYQSYRLTPVNNGYPQGRMGYVEYRGLLDGSVPELTAGTYSWLVCTLGSGAFTECKDSTTGVLVPNTYVKSVVISESGLDPEAASASVDNTKLFAFGDRPAQLSAISITDIAANTFSDTALSTSVATPTDVAAGPYTVSWVSSVQNPTSVEWQAIFIEVDNISGNPIQFAEIRSPRFRQGEIGGPVFDSVSSRYTWSLDPDLKINNNTSTVKVIFRVSNSLHTFSADTEAFFLTCSAC